MVSFKAASHSALAPTAPKTLNNIVVKPTMSDVVRPGANHLNKKPQPSRILMRKAVKKPVLTPANKIKAASAVSKLPAKKPTHTLQAKLSVANLDNKRAERALSVAKSHQVTRFHKTTHHVAPHKQLQELTPPQLENTTAVHHKNKHHTPKERTTADLFEEAITHATSHHQAHHHKKKKRIPKQTGALIASFAVILAVSGIFASQNIGNFKMHLAASKAGFSASLPDYQPSGYHLEKINSDAGVVAANFLSNSDDRSYTLTQKPSKWDSQALKELFVAKNSQDYYAVEKNGLTIYIYGDGQATWVNGGVWYQLTANGVLSDRQLIELASSL